MTNAAYITIDEYRETFGACGHALIPSQCDDDDCQPMTDAEITHEIEEGGLYRAD